MASIHYMNLNNDPFQLIKNQTKTIEMRLYDEKRRMIAIGDRIIFKNNKTEEIISVKVVNLFIYKDFFALYQEHDKVSIGYDANDIANPEDMYQYYSEERILKYGVVGIAIALE